MATSCVVCGGWAAEDLEALDDLLEEALGAVPPVLVLGREDMLGGSVRDLVSPESLARRDHELPQRPPDLRMPIVILGGLDAPRVSRCLAGLRNKFPNVSHLNLRLFAVTSWLAVHPQGRARAAGTGQDLPAALRGDPRGPRAYGYRTTPLRIAMLERCIVYTAISYNTNTPMAVEESTSFALYR